MNGNSHGDAKASSIGWSGAGICLLLALLVFAVFGQTRRFEFVNYDDDQYVYANPVVAKGLSLHGAAWTFTHVHAHNWHPLTTLSHMLDCQLHGQQPGWHHLSNVLLHATGAILLFLMLLELTGARWRSAFVAALFAIHPLRVESVAWVSERKDLLSGIFFMLTLWAYARYARHGSKGSIWRFAAVVSWFALGLMSKPMLVTTPFVLLLLDYWPLGRLNGRGAIIPLLREKAPLFLLSAIVCAVTVLVQQETLQPLERLSLAGRIENALVACSIYLEKLVYPLPMAVLYPLLKNGWQAWQIALSLLLLAAITAWTIRARHRQPYLLAGWLWYLGMLVPVIGILQVGRQAYADRYTYLPQIGLCIAITWLVAEWTSGWRWRRLALGAGAATVLSVFAAEAWVQATYWHDSAALWTHTLRCTKENYVADVSLGLTLVEHGQTGDGIAHYREALRINPGYAEAHNDLGMALFQEGKTAEAVAEYRETLRLKPASTEAHNNLGNALRRLGQVDEAIAEYHRALQCDLRFAMVHNNLGNALLQQGKTDDAIAEYEAALEIDPGLELAHYNLGNALFDKERPGEAAAQYRETLRLNSRNVDAHNNLGSALLQLNNAREAIAEFQEALRLDPANRVAKENLRALQTGP